MNAAELALDGDGLTRKAIDAAADRVIPTNGQVYRAKARLDELRGLVR